MGTTSPLVTKILAHLILYYLCGLPSLWISAKIFLTGTYTIFIIFSVNYKHIGHLVRKKKINLELESFSIIIFIVYNMIITKKLGVYSIIELTQSLIFHGLRYFNYLKIKLWIYRNSWPQVVHLINFFCIILIIFVI